MGETGGQQIRILIVDRDPSRRRTFHGQLLAESFVPIDAEHPEEALELCRVSEFDLILLGAESARSAIEYCHLLRTVVPKCGLAVLAEFNDPGQTAEVLEAGADQCLPGSLYLPELLAHMRAIVRRTRVAGGPADAAVTIGEIRLDPVQRMVSRAGVPIYLSLKEFSLLHYLMTHAGIPIAHESLLKAVWGEDCIDRTDYLRSLVVQLRRKLKDQSRPEYLLTESWIGYRFVSASEAAPTARQEGHAAAA